MKLLLPFLIACILIYPSPASAENMLPEWSEVKTEFDLDYAPQMDKYFAFLAGSALFGLSIKGLIGV